MKRLALRLVLAGALGLGVATAAVDVGAAGVSVEQATAEQKTAAQTKFGTGMAAFEKKQFDAALTAFRESYNIVASPNSHLMVARSLRELGKLAESAAEYEGVLAEAKTDKKYAETLKSAETEYGELKPKLGFVTVQLQNAGPDASVEIGGKAVDASKLGGPIAVDPGTVNVVVKSSKGEQTKTATVAAGATESLTIDLAPPPPVAPPPTQDSGVKVDSRKFGMRQWAYVAGGVGAAGLLTFGVFGLMNNAKHSDLEDACPGGRCPADRESDIDSGKTYQTVANVGLGLGIVGLGTGAVLYVLSSKKKPQEQPRASTVPQVMVGPGSFMVRGQF